MLTDGVRAKEVFAYARILEPRGVVGRYVLSRTPLIEYTINADTSKSILIRDPHEPNPELVIFQGSNYASYVVTAYPTSGSNAQHTQQIPLMDDPDLEGLDRTPRRLLVNLHSTLRRLRNAKMAQQATAARFSDMAVA